MSVVMRHLEELVSPRITNFEIPETNPEAPHSVSPRPLTENPSANRDG